MTDATQTRLADQTAEPRTPWEKPRLDCVSMASTRQVSKGAAPGQDPFFAPDATS